SVTEGAVGSSPSFTRRGRPASNLSRNSSSGTTSAAPDNSRSTGAETMSRREATSGHGGARSRRAARDRRRARGAAGVAILAVLAFERERRMTKDQILAGYLNTVYFGQGAYGIQAAAKTYFSEPASAIDLQQAALLTGLIQAPSAYDPVDHPQRAKERRNIVL